MIFGVIGSLMQRAMLSLEKVVLVLSLMEKYTPDVGMENWDGFFNAWWIVVLIQRFYKRVGLIWEQIRFVKFYLNYDSV